MSVKQVCRWATACLHLGATWAHRHGCADQDGPATLVREPASALRLSRCNESSTPASNALRRNVVSIHPHQPGENVKSQPYCTRQESASIAVQVVVCWLMTPNPLSVHWI